MFLTDFLSKVVRVSKALTTKSPAYGLDYRHETAHHPERYRGQHRVNYETCIGCDACNKICPVHAITMKKLSFKKQNIVPEVNLSVCIFCGLCEDVCPTKPEKSIVLSGGRYDMLTGGWHEDQEDFWVHVNIPEEYIKSRLEAEEAARVAKEMKKKKMEAEKRAKEKAAEAGSSEQIAGSNETVELGLPDFSAPSITEVENPGSEKRKQETSDKGQGTEKKGGRK
ncbi:4Fe-4S binding protein [Nitratifractor sp.]